MLVSFLIKLQDFWPEILSKEIPTEIFSCECCEIFKNTYFEEHFQTAASAHRDIIEIYYISMLCTA